MLLAGSSLCLSRRALPEAMLGLSDLGFEAVDLGVQQDWAHISPSELVRHEAEWADWTRQLLEQYSLRPVALNVGLKAQEPEERRQRWEAVCRFAALLGVPVLTLPAPPVDAPWEEAISTLKELVAIAQEQGVVPTIETHLHTLAERPEMALRLCEEVEGLGLTLDPSHFVAGPAQGQGYEMLYPLVRHVHLRDAAPGRVQVPLGQGQVPFQRILEGLRGVGYPGALSVEFLDTLAGGDVATEVKRLREHLLALQHRWGEETSP